MLSSSQLMFVFLLSFFSFSFITFTPVSADGNTYNINNASDFIDFANKVNNDGTTFSGTTVLLSDDIDFSSCSDDFGPVGTDSNYFTGIFDGQGHTITNLVVNSSDFRCTSLFGYSRGLTIKNLIIDGSCSFTSYCNRSGYVDAFVSSVVGEANSTTCTIESVVNMANVSYLHGSRSYVMTGGIVAKCTGNCSFTNIVNFGSVLTTSDKSSNYIYSGGIAGEVDGSSDFVSIRNCINYGTVINTIRGNYYILVGGITGVVWSNVAIENCLAAGPVSSVESSNSYTGSIIGGTGSSSPPSNNTINNCFWIESAGGLNASGQVIDDTSVLNTTNTSTIEMNESALAMIRDTMNTATSSECVWVTVHLNGGRFGNSTQEDLPILFMQKNLVTGPVKEGYSFVTWCSDTKCTKSCNSSSVSECTSTELYAAWNVSTVTIDFDNGTVIDVGVEFNSTINIPNVSEREGHKFIGWNDTIPTNMPAHNIATKAIWINVTSPSESVEIVFGTKDLSNDEINELIQKYAGGGGYKITNITHTNDGISVIVKFNDVSEAMGFVENISASSGMNGAIVRISFINANVVSFSIRSVPSFFLIIFSVLFTLI